jgi:hypothetical protein
LVIEDPSIGSAPVFITEDAEDLESQDSSFNRLFWVSGYSIMSTTLDEQFSWCNAETVYTGIHPVGGLMARRDAEGDLWLLFDERDRPDSVAVRALIQQDETEAWVGPQFLVRAGGSASQAALNLHQCYWEEREMLLSWVEESVYHDTIIRTLGGLVTLLDGWYGVVPGSDLRIAANTLITSGCVVEPLPHVCYSTREDSLYRIMWLNDNWWEQGEVLAIRGHPVEHVAMSGLTNCHFLCCWSESDGEQSDIYAVCCYIQVGSADEHPGGSPRLELLSCGPNPTTDRATIRYRMLGSGNVFLGLYDNGGRRLRELDTGWQETGAHSIAIDTNGLPAGVYSCHLQSPTSSRVWRIVVLR